MTREATAPALVTVDCPGCGSPDGRFELLATDPISGERFDTVRCERCGLIYVNPRPEGPLLASYYAVDYYGARHPIFKRFFMALRARKLGRPPAGARVLDIGCGRGDFLLAAESRGWKMAGVERAYAPIVRVLDSLHIPVVSPEELSKLPDASFDAVTLWHVLEHLPEPRSTLAEVQRLLRPGGHLFVEVPNFGGWQARMSREAWYHLDVPRHLLHFNRRSLTHLLVASGFTPARWQTFSLEYDTFGLAQSVLNRVCSSPNHLFNLLTGGVQSAGGRLDTAVSFALLPPLLVFAGTVSLLAALAGQGGVLHVTARKTPVTSARLANPR